MGEVFWVVGRRSSLRWWPEDAKNDLAMGTRGWLYPYMLLNLFLSMLAGVQAAALLIAAKRADAISSEIVIHTEHNTDDIKGSSTRTRPPLPR